MLEINNLDDRFQIALQGLAAEAVRQCDYEPKEYLRGISKLGGLSAVKQFLAEPPSDDSLQLWARGRRDLTIEALARKEEWADLFSENERAIADRRYADWSFSMTTEHGLESPDMEFKHIEGSEQDPEPQFFVPEDDILWGEELATGLHVCEKLAQENRALIAGYERLGGWCLSYYRTHLADCKICAQECSFLRTALEEFDATELMTLGQLLAQCVSSLGCSWSRAKDLLSAEWKAAGFELLPSEAEAVGITDYGWKNPAKTETRQVDDWCRALHMRAGQLAAVIGQAMAQYEETHIPRFGGLGTFPENPWLVWRTNRESSAVVRFVRGLSEDEFLTALMAKHIVELQAFDHAPPLTLPTDGDLCDIPKFLIVEKTAEVDAWTKILLANLTRRTLHIHTLNLDQPDQTKSKSRLSDFSKLDWGRILYLAWCAASREASAVESGIGQATLPDLTVLTDRLDSISAAQMPIIDLLERMASNMNAKDQKKAAEESLQAALGSQIYNCLSDGAWTNAVAAEVILHNANFPNPGTGVGVLCTAFEWELKYGLLTRFANFLRSRRINHFPDGRMEDGSFWPQIMRAGDVNARLTLEKIRIALSSPRPEIEEFCSSEGIDLTMLRNTIEYVKECRNPHAHGVVVSFAQAQRIREKLLGIASGDGGVFGILVPLNLRRVQS